MVEMGALLAQIHKIPTDWYDGCRHELMERYPALRAAPLGSHIWYFAFNTSSFEGLRDGCLQSWIAAGEDFFPLSPVAARVVTCHGDFHPGNVVRAQSGLSVIDFETACVACAAQDIAWAFKLFLQDIRERRLFVGAYLTASGENANHETIDDVCFDAECFSLGLWLGALHKRIQVLQSNPYFTMQSFKEYTNLVQEARRNDCVRRDILENGIVSCLYHRQGRV
eukprot:gnl/TRDRNA2_/TRDRNA2_135705_c0_seq1.p1 gnl/TRDRNA2_/TRDRNA2_135705_c0~~gnl/TRDRNA2_/TRDRNA2_135705_c0_seq1.p1  ORF type:complete len:258 (+),score=20.19 gnl/TRDRNA2_/TRDRNA2_135705_c0_seq1:105-776(+)